MELYKYTSSGHLASIVAENYLWFSHIDWLYDPFECNITQLEYSCEIYE